MEKKTGKRVLSLLLAGVVAIGLAGCGNRGSSDPAMNQVTGSTTGGGTDKKDLVTVTMYPRDANVSSGVVGSHKGEYFAENGFALEVWAYSDEKTNAILASGDLPDIMYVHRDNLDVMIEAGMLLKLDDYLDQMPNVKSANSIDTALNYVREFRSAGTGDIYGLPLSVGDNQTRDALSDSTERYALKLRWDVYEEIGAPEIKDIWGLIDVMEQMMKKRPTAEDGSPYYGTVLNAGADTTFWNNMTLFYAWQGYTVFQLPYLLESNMITGEASSILSKDSKYYEGLKWYNEVYRRGLMDPDSINNDRATQKAKLDAGYVMVPSGSLPGWSTKYYEYLLPGTKVHYNYTSPYGDADHVIAINAKSENIDTCIKILDMWFNPDAYCRIINGPEGDLWYTEGEDAYLTDKTLEFLKNKGDSAENIKYENGEEWSLWNIPFGLNTGSYTSYGDGKGGKRVLRYSSWQEAREIAAANETYDKWKKTTGYDTWKDWLEAEDSYVSKSKLDQVINFCSKPDDSMQLTIDAIKDVVVNSSWKMVYAESDAEFDSIWDSMVADCEGLNAQSIIDWRLNDIEQAKAVKESLEK